jgi:hypothetical protein
MKLHSGITYDQAVAVMGKPIAVDTLDDGMYVYWGKDGKKWWDKDRHIPGVRVWIENGLVRLITIHGIEVPKRPN